MPAVPDPNELNKIPLFKDLERHELAQICELLRVVESPAGNTVISASHASKKKPQVKDRVAYVIHQGVVKVQVKDMDHPEERNVILAILGPGQIVGEMSLADGRDYSATIVTLTDTTLLSITHTSLRDCLAKMPILMRNLARILTDRLRLANGHIQSLATLKVRTRVARQILFLARTYGHRTNDGHVHIPFGLTQVDLADLVGATRISVHRVIAAFKKQEIITVDSYLHVITILDQERLEILCRPDS